MKMIEAIQELLPWLSGVAVVTRVAISFVIVSLAALALTIVWVEIRPPTLSEPDDPEPPRRNPRS